MRLTISTGVGSGATVAVGIGAMVAVGGIDVGVGSVLVHAAASEMIMSRTAPAVPVLSLWDEIEAGEAFFPGNSDLKFNNTFFLHT